MMLESGVPTSVVSADRYVVEAEYRNSDLEADEYPGGISLWAIFA